MCVSCVCYCLLDFGALINQCRDAPNNMRLLEEVLANYKALVTTENAGIQPLHVTTTDEVVSKLRSLPDEQLACVFQVEPHSVEQMASFINALLGADMSPAVVQYIKGFDQTHRVSMDLGGIMMIGVIFDLAVANLATKMMTLQEAEGLPNPFTKSTHYCFLTSAVGWALGAWAGRKADTVLGKRKSVGDAAIIRMSVLYAHDVCVHDKKTPTEDLVKAYRSCFLMSDASASTWITPSPASRVVSTSGVFRSMTSGEVGVHMGAAKQFVNDCQSTNVPFDFVAALLSDNSIGQLVSKASTQSFETVVVPVGVLKPVIIAR